MPKIPEYSARRFSLNPSDRAISAYETVGRRIGPLYNAAAQDIREQGRVEASAIKARSWPYDIAEFYDRTEPDPVRPTSTGFRTRGGRRGGGGGRGHGEVSAGARGMTRLARDAVNQQKYWDRYVDQPDFRTGAASRAHRVDLGDYGGGGEVAVETGGFWYSPSAWYDAVSGAASSVGGAVSNAYDSAVSGLAGALGAVNGSTDAEGSDVVATAPIE